MKTLVIYYSFSGHARELAKKLAKEEQADLQQLLPVKPVGKLKAYTAGCFAAIKGAAWDIKAPDADLAAYEKLVICAPIWAGNVAPYVNALLEMLPAGKQVQFKLMSGSGQSNCRERLEKAVAGKGCALAGFEDIKG